MLIRNGKEIVLVDMGQAQILEDGMDPQQFQMGRKADLLSLIHSLISMVDQNLVWLRSQDSGLEDLPQMERSLPLQPILKFVK